MENYDASEELHSPNYILYILLGIVLIVVGKVDESTISVYLGFASLTAAIVSLMRPIVVYLVKRSARRASQRKEQWKQRLAKKKEEVHNTLSQQSSEESQNFSGRLEPTAAVSLNE